NHTAGPLRRSNVSRKRIAASLFALLPLLHADRIRLAAFHTGHGRRISQIEKRWTKIASSLPYSVMACNSLCLCYLAQPTQLRWDASLPFYPPADLCLHGICN